MKEATLEGLWEPYAWIQAHPVLGPMPPLSDLTEKQLARFWWKMQDSLQALGWGWGPQGPGK